MVRWQNPQSRASGQLQDARMLAFYEINPAFCFFLKKTRKEMNTEESPLNSVDSGELKKSEPLDMVQSADKKPSSQSCCAPHYVIPRGSPGQWACPRHRPPRLCGCSPSPPANGAGLFSEAQRHVWRFRFIHTLWDASNCTFVLSQASTSRLRSHKWVGSSTGACVTEAYFFFFKKSEVSVLLSISYVLNSPAALYISFGTRKAPKTHTEPTPLPLRRSRTY
jgi:hypothetical protein